MTVDFFQKNIVIRQKQNCRDNADNRQHDEIGWKNTFDTARVKLYQINFYTALDQ